MELYTENPTKKTKLPIYLDDTATNAHDGAMFKIILIEAGKTILFIDDKPMVVSAPALLCLNEKENLRTDEGDGLIIRVLYFLPSIVNSFLDIEKVHRNIETYPETAKLDHFYFLPFIDRETDAGTQVDIGVLTAKKLSALLDTLNAKMRDADDAFWPCKIRSYLIEILFIIQHCYSEKDALPVDIPKSGSCINDVLLYLHINYNRTITITELTNEFHTNRNTLSKNFRIATGLSIIEYIRKLRIRTACMLLRDTSLPVNEIMQRVGFDDISYWGRTFKSITGTAPSEYRKSHTTLSLPGN